MRGEGDGQAEIFVAMTLESRIPGDHPLRRIRKLVDGILGEMDGTFRGMYAKTGRPSIAPEHLLKSALLMALYSIRSERMYCEQLEYNLLFRWFLGMSANVPAFHHSVFSHNQERMLRADVAKEFFARVVAAAELHKLVSDEHFTVDGTLIESWASLKSFRPKGEDGEPPAGSLGNGSVDFHGEKRRNDTHESKTDPDARLYRKGAGKEARLYLGLHALTENRHGLLLDLRVSSVIEETETEAALKLIDQRRRKRRKPRSVGADKGYDNGEFVNGLRRRGITPHVAAKKKYSAVDGRTTRHASYAVSQRKRKLVEQSFGWLKAPGRFRRTRYVGLAINQMHALLHGAACNLVRLANLLGPPGPEPAYG